MKKGVGEGCIVGCSQEAQAAVVGCKWVGPVACTEVVGAVDCKQVVAVDCKQVAAVVVDCTQAEVVAVAEAAGVQCNSCLTGDGTAFQTHTAPPRVTGGWEDGQVGGWEVVELQDQGDAAPRQDPRPADA